jgi:hypothetical protein
MRELYSHLSDEDYLKLLNSMLAGPHDCFYELCKKYDVELRVPRFVEGDLCPHSAAAEYQKATEPYTLSPSRDTLKSFSTGALPTPDGDLEEFLGGRSVDA